MNTYVVVEGEIGERKVYEHWIPLVNKQLSHVDSPDKAVDNNFYIISGGGYPNIFKIIEDAIQDIAAYTQYTRLVVSIDSELQTREEKEDEIKEYIESIGCPVNYKIIIQHFCLETWAIANRKIFTKNISEPELLQYKGIFDVLINDPERIPSLERQNLNRAQFNYKYLRLLLKNKFKRLSYTKSNPGPLLNDKYFDQVRKRLEDTGHIDSFNSFLTAFE